jgi:hypothetical protein
MTISKPTLANMIKDLECRVAVATADKYSKALKYGVGCVDCVHNKITIANGVINVLKRFYADGKDCEDACSLTTGQWVVTHACGYLFTPFTSYACTYIYVDSAVENIVNGIVVFSSDGTFVFTRQNGAVSSGTYSYDSTTDSIVVVASNFFSPLAIVFSNDCDSMTLTYDNPLNAQTVTLYLTNSTVQSNSCDWAENCITEEEAIALYQNTSSMIGKRCNCG